MLVRAFIIVAVSAFLAGCASNQPLSSGLVSPAQAADADGDPSKQTLASKILGAMALEQVTDRKPDPSRLNELH